MAVTMDRLRQTAKERAQGKRLSRAQQAAIVKAALTDLEAELNGMALQIATLARTVPQCMS